VTIAVYAWGRAASERIREGASGKFVGPSEEGISFDDLAHALLDGYQINGNRSTG
jgi:hypothetical protein